VIKNNHKLNFGAGLLLTFLFYGCIASTDVKTEQETPTVINDLQVACANNAQNIEELKAENAKIRGEMEKLEHSIKQYEAALNKNNIVAAEKEQAGNLSQEVTANASTTVGTPAATGAPAAASTAPTAATTAAVVTAAAATTNDIDERYKLARKNHEQKNYEIAEKYYTSMIGTKSSWSDEKSRFFLGKMYVEWGQYKKAIIALQDFADKYPKSRNIANAVYAQAESFLALNQKKEAEVFLKDVIQRFPRTEEAKLARKRLQSI